MNNFFKQPKPATLLIAFFICVAATAQNVGINNTNPNERLDVNGNINVTGTIKANGVDGTANQVLMKNSIGTLVWGDMCQYKNVAILTATTGTWTVPAGVTSIYAEAWGAGGGGNTFGGGAGGSYIAAEFTVTPGQSVSYGCGVGGSGAGFSTANSGIQSFVQLGGPALTIIAAGGGGAGFSTLTTGTCGSPNTTLSVGAGVTNYVYEFGKAGEPPLKTYMQYNATTYYETGNAGRGGAAAHTVDGTATGGYYVFNTTANTLVLRSSKNATGIFPGGGGAGGIDYPLASISGGNGAAGLVIIRW